MSKLRETFLSQLADIYNAEDQLIKALPKMAKAAEHEDLKSAFESHLEETEGHIERLEKVFKSLGEKVKSKTCKAMEGLIKEGKESLMRRKEMQHLSVRLKRSNIMKSPAMAAYLPEPTFWGRKRLPNCLKKR